MSTYMTEEEQIEQIKQWWNKYGNIISTIVLVIVVIFAFFRYWQWHSQKVIVQASSLYEQLLVAYTNQDNMTLVSRANKLLDNYGKTVYGDAASLILAKIAAEKKAYDEAIMHLKTVANNNDSIFSQIAKLRLVRVLIAHKHYESALSEIDAISNESYSSLVNELRGDIYSAMGKYGKAKNAYKKALSTTRMQNVGNIFLEMKTNEVARQQMSEQFNVKTA